MRRIFLIGLPGSGKSVVGREVARILGWNFLDTDDLLADRMGMPTGEVLVKYGEERFRQLETEVLLGASEQECVVVATGGGIVIAEANRTFMREHGPVIYLRASVETAWQRVQEHLRESEAKAVRPLLLGGDGKQRLGQLYVSRQQWYEQATIQIDTDAIAPDVMAQQIVVAALATGNLSSSSTK
jgi:shikimate kinase